MLPGSITLKFHLAPIFNLNKLNNCKVVSTDGGIAVALRTAASSKLLRAIVYNAEL